MRECALHKNKKAGKKIQKEWDEKTGRDTEREKGDKEKETEEIKQRKTEQSGMSDKEKYIE
mgnify:CR=1 FL=1